MSIVENALKFLKKREFVEIATADKEGKPNSAPKILLKAEDREVYLIDYSIGKTFYNLQVNPRVCFSFIDSNSLFGYRLSGKAEIIEKGLIYDECLKELREKEIKLTVERVVKGVHDNKDHKNFELEMSGHFLIYKIKIEEGSEISPRGQIKKEDC
ncbi:MAG: pyridoxamine 5'-phosphate oxidase family protein [Candidatus Omnitrophica bacterium]|jgi:predicted pyridoxine 5'-phosphate oxidase superfamily flavin-nucleotide-binding protein|nr:pyridoxamine 5'-phosphate oxidase family protein [Candidatus Omnitrophota bacterium]MDD5661355.1 pyridoxamine 5'-phosphate oxidase family protein [Candidatus Omnitrophota bacterium]